MKWVRARQRIGLLKRYFLALNTNEMRWCLYRAMGKLAKSHFSLLLIYVEYNSPSRRTVNKLTCKHVRKYSVHFWSSASLVVAVYYSFRICLRRQQLTSVNNDRPLKVNSHFSWDKITTRENICNLIFGQINI